MRRAFLALTLAYSLLDGAHGHAQSPAAPVALANSLRAALNPGALPGATFSVMVAEATSGRTLFAEGEGLSLNPASNTKLLTAAAALSLLGPSHIFETAVHGARDGEVVRDLVLRGDGDPSLREGDLDALAASLAGSGVRVVEGDVRLDDARFGSEHLPPAFEQRPDEEAAYRAAVSALSIDENALTLSVRGDAEGARCAAWATPATSAQVDVDAVASRSAALTVRTAPLPDGRTRAVLAGRCALGASSVRRRIHDPTRATGLAFVAALRRRGIRVGDGLVLASPSPRPPVLASHTSLPLSALLYEVGKDSNNFTAEMVLLAIGAASPGETTFARAAERVVGWARDRGVATTGLVLRNGSGLYDANRMSARQVTQVLRAAWRDPSIRDEYVAQLAVGGADGTLRGRLGVAGAPRVVRAKTGTLDDAVALSGYVLTRDPSRTLAFSVLVNGVRGRSEIARRCADSLVAELVRSTRAR